MRFIDKNIPLIGPYFLIASIAYSEQDGLYLQDIGSIGDIKILYILIGNIKIAVKVIFIILNNFNALII